MLLDFGRHGDTEVARKSLEEAVEANKHVPAYLTGKKKLPRSLPASYGFGDVNEAVLFVNDHGAAWRKLAGALPWMSANART